MTEVGLARSTVLAYRRSLGLAAWDAGAITSAVSCGSNGSSLSLAGPRILVPADLAACWFTKEIAVAAPCFPKPLPASAKSLFNWVLAVLDCLEPAQRESAVAFVRDFLGTLRPVGASASSLVRAFAARPFFGDISSSGGATLSRASARAVARSLVPLTLTGDSNLCVTLPTPASWANGQPRGDSTNS